MAIYTVDKVGPSWFVFEDGVQETVPFASEKAARSAIEERLRGARPGLTGKTGFSKGRGDGNA